MAECSLVNKHSSLVSNRGAMFVWPNLATADSLYGHPSAINQVCY